jgi:predicted nucleic acid-binding protein
VTLTPSFMVQNDKIVVDSSVLVALYCKSDANHGQAKIIFSEMENATIIIHPYVIQETTTVLTYVLGFSTAKEFLNDIEQASNVLFSHVIIAMDIEVFRKVSRKISFTDVAVVALAHKEKAQLLTFDKQMITLAKTFK